MKASPQEWAELAAIERERVITRVQEEIDVALRSFEPEDEFIQGMQWAVKVIRGLP